MKKGRIGPWQTKATPEGSGLAPLGFVYLVEVEGMFYIGCKQLFSTRTLPPLKGQKRKRKVVKDSDWRTYYGSSKKLKQDVEEGAPVTRHILYWAYSKSELAYVELRLQMSADALRSPFFYNGIMNVRLPALKLRSDYKEAYAFAEKQLKQLTK